MTDQREILKTCPEAIALAEHIFAYRDKPQRFETSWTNYSTSPTTHESRIDDLLAVLYPEQERRDYVIQLPSIVIALVSLHTKRAEDIVAAKKFIADAIEDLVECHLREDVPDNMTNAEFDRTYAIQSEDACCHCGHI